MRRADPTLLQRFPIRRGAHPTRDAGLCAMEMVAWLAGEDHSDAPQCTCPVLAAFVRAFNDLLPSDELREHYLRPLLPRLVNTRGNSADARVRGFRLADAAARVLAPLALEREEAPDEAAALRALPAVTDTTTAKAALELLQRHHARTHAAQWTLSRAASGQAAWRWAAGAAGAARDVGTPQAWAAAAAVLDALLPSPTDAAPARPDHQKTT